MKFLLLPVLSWTLAISQLFAQHELPASIQPYAVNWGYTVKQMLHAAGYEVPGPKASFDLVKDLESRSEELQLDSTVSYFGYGVGAQDSMPLFRTTYTYPDPTTQVIVEYFYDQNHWTALSRTTLKSDDLGRMKEMTAETYDSEAGLYRPDSRIQLFPRENAVDLVDSFFVYAWAAAEKNWDRQFGVWNIYNELNQLVESESSIEIFDVPLVFIDRYSYSASGDLLKIESSTLDGGEEIPSGKQEFIYTDHLLVKSTTYVSDGIGGYILQSKIEYTYTDFGKEELVNSFQYDVEKNDWTLIGVDGYGYDDQERVIVKEIVTATAEGLWERHQTRTNYLSDESVASEAEYSYNDNTESWVLDNKKFYYYDHLSTTEPDEPVVADALFLYPNPSSGVVQIKLVGKISIYVYSLSGQLVQRFNMAPGQKILDLRALPAGIYQVRAKSDEDYFSGKLILQ
jgi:hypothetical protein